MHNSEGCTGCTCLLGRMYEVYIASQRDVFGIGLETYDGNLIMTSHMKCMLICNVGEMMKICTGCTWILGRMYGVYIASQRDVLEIGLKIYD